MSGDDNAALLDSLLDGDHRALARVITKIENREPGYRALVSRLYRHGGEASIVGVTGSPGSGKSTLVDRLALAYREKGLTVGILCIDPSSPFSGGAVLGDRIRMAGTVGDMDVFVRSMSARGALGGLSTATQDAITAFDAFGMDRIIVETVGAGQNEVDIVRTADTVVVLVQPGSGDDVQMLKAGILEIGDVFVVNKADRPGADRTVQELTEMLQLRRHSPDAHESDWDPRIVETVATEGRGVETVLDALADHRSFLTASGRHAEMARARHAETVRRVLREYADDLLEREIDRRGGIDELVDAIVADETDPYAVAREIVEPLADALEADRS